MDFSSFAKPSYLLGGVGLTGTSAAGIVGINNYVDGTRTGQDRLNRQGFTLDTNQFSGSAFNTREQVNTSAGARSKLSFKSGDCFSKFFPGVSDPGVPASGPTQTPSPATFNIAPGKNPIGCQVIKYSEKSASNSKISKAFVYKAEITVRTENFGWSLSIGSTNIHDTSDAKFKLTEKRLDIELRALFLKKTSSSWSIQQGYT